jgi:hypothetical protein
MPLLFLSLLANGIISRFYFMGCTHCASHRIIEKILIVRNNGNSSYVFMKYIDVVSLYLLYFATKSRQNNSTFFVEACISKITESAVIPIPGSHSCIFTVGFTFLERKK